MTRKVLPCRLYALVLTLALLAAWPCPFSAAAEETPPKQEKAAQARPSVNAAADTAEEPLSFTRHTSTIEGKSVAYAAVAGRIAVRDDAGKVRARIFFTSYTREGEAEGMMRPVTFCFNGGPGAASVFLHMAAVGPKRVLFSGKGEPQPPPYRWAANPYTWLGFTDLVFVDPVGTGYSRPEAGIDAKEFFGVREDTRSMAQFIGAYCTRFDRWPSPKFILGESYGATRAAALAGYLQSIMGLPLNGLILISPALDFQTFTFAKGNDLPYVLYLPAYACAAWYHKKTALSPGTDLAHLRSEVERFAYDEYWRALMKGDTLTDEEIQRVAEALSGFTGLSKEYVTHANLRIDRDVFLSELLRPENLTVSVVDSRRTARYPVSRFLDDPGMFYLFGPLAAGWNDYVRKELRYESTLSYEVLLERAAGSWDWGSASQGYVDETPVLADAIKKNRALRIFLANGYYDLDTSYFSTVYAVNHLGLDKDLRANATMAFYPSGHQIYTEPSSLEQLYRDVSGFVERTMNERPSHEIDH
jgi:carboxypeptidase C (cathepsin A)